MLGLHRHSRALSFESATTKHKIPTRVYFTRISSVIRLIATDFQCKAPTARARGELGRPGAPARGVCMRHADELWLGPEASI